MRRFYLSGSVDAPTERHIVDVGMPRLFTFAYPEEPRAFLDYADSVGAHTKVMLDSGAFTAWSKGKPVKLQNLLRWHDAILAKYGSRHEFQLIALDVIPGNKESGKRTDKGEIERAMEQSVKNLDHMLQYHTAPVWPVYHSGEPLWYRDVLVGKAGRLCLSMNQRLSEKKRVEWAMEVWPEGVNLHGLAATGNMMMEYVPWWSVDSAAWVMVGGMGAIFWDNGKKVSTILVSADSSGRKVAGKHVETLRERALVEEKIRAAGYELEQLMFDYRARWCWNIDVLKSRYIQDKSSVRQGGLFDA